MTYEVVLAGIPMEIKGKGTIGYEDVVAGIAFARNDPLGTKTCERGGLKIDARQNVAGAVAEEYAVRQLPPAKRVLLDAWLQYVHRLMIAQPQ
jgi:hypothetical protein